jgi:catechol 2,3-dioxygenase-like lactoylglutathione lyase family enzyme
MKVLFAFVLPLALAAADLKIDHVAVDHVTVAGANLDAMRRAFTAVTNLPTEYGGPHSNHATEMALVSFPDGSYLELMGIQPKSDPVALAAHVWGRFLRNNAGPCAFALRATDLDAEVAHLKSVGISVGKPESSGRTRPDGTRLAWETLDEGSGPRGSLLPFLIRDITPRKKRAFPGGKPTTTRFSGIGKVVVGVSDLDGAIALYRRAFNLGAPRRENNADFEAGFDTSLAWFEGTPIVLAQGLSESSWLTRRVSEYGAAPVAFLIDSTGGVAGSGHISTWFGRPIFWADEKQLGWRLGIE